MERNEHPGIETPDYIALWGKESSEEDASVDPCDAPKDGAGVSEGTKKPEEDDGSDDDDYGLRAPYTRENIDISARWFDVPPIVFCGETASDEEYRREIEILKTCYSFFKVSSRGKVSFDDFEVSRYVKAHYVVFSEAGDMFRYNGFFYQPFPRVCFDKIMYGISKAMEVAPPTLGSIENCRNLTRTENLIMDLPMSNKEEYADDIIPFQNGLYNVDRDLLLPFTPKYFCTSLRGATYDPSIKYHSVEHVYKSIIPDSDTRMFFFEMVGYMLFSPEQTIPAMFCIYGPAETGKSALGKAIEAAMGIDAISYLDLMQISDKFTTAEMEGKLLNICGETGTGVFGGRVRSDGQLLKKISEGETVTVQRKNQRPFMMKATAKLLFLTNSVPNFGDTTSGIYRRLYIIPCRQKQKTEDRIYDKLTDEEAVSWLVNQALKGYKRFVKNGNKFDVSAEMESEKTAFRTQEPIQDFILEKFGTLDVTAVHVGLLHTNSVNEVYQEYRVFMDDSGGKALDIRKFSEKLRNEYGLSSGRRHIRRCDGGDTTEAFFVEPGSDLDANKSRRKGAGE